MELVQAAYNDRSQLAALISQYQAQVRNRTIKPALIKELTLDGICQYDTILAAQEDGRFLGLLHYEFISRTNFDCWRRRFHAHFDGTLWIPDEDNPPLSKILRLDGFRKYTGMGPLIFLRQMEVFNKRNGIGTILLNAIKEHESVEGIFLEVLCDPKNAAKSFYQRNGFNETGLVIKKKGPGAIIKLKPVMIWIKSGEY